MTDFSIHDTTIGISCDTPEESRKFFHMLCNLLRRNGFVVDKDPRIEQNYKCLSKSHRAGNHGDLKFKAEWFPVGLRFEFYQSIVFENPHGGEYDFDKLAKMPYLVRMRFTWTINLISEFLQARGFVRKERFNDWHADPLRAFNDGWTAERFKRGPDGWPSDSELKSWCRSDADGVPIYSGQTRFVRVNGRYLRCKVYGGINGMWHCLAPGIHRQEHATSLRSVFPGRGRIFTSHDRQKTLKRELGRAVKGGKYLRAHAISNIIKEPA